MRRKRCGQYSRKFFFFSYAKKINLKKNSSRAKRAEISLPKKTHTLSAQTQQSKHAQ